MIRDLTTGNITGRIFMFALPMFAGQILQQLFNVVDGIIVGNLIGKEALAAVGASFPVIYLIISFIIGIVSGSTILISQYFGAKDSVTVKKAIDTLYTFVLIVSIILPVLVIPNSEWIFRIMKLPEEIIPDAKTYFNIFIGGMFFMFGLNGTSAVLRGLGDSRTPLFFIILATLLNIGLDILFIRFFHWGIAGAAYATVLSHGISFLISIIYLNKYHKVFNLSLKNLQLSREVLIKSLKVGVPMGFHQITVAFSLTIMFSIVNTFGTTVIAAYTAGSRVSSLAGMPPMVFGSTIATFTGQNIGAGKLFRVKKGLISTMILASSFALISSACIYFFSEQIIGLFLGKADDSAEIIRIGSEYLRIICWYYIIFAGMFVINGQMQGAGDTLIPMVITIFTLWFIRIPGAYYFSKIYAEKAVWWAFPISWCLSFLLSWIYYLTGKWKRKILVNGL